MKYAKRGSLYRFLLSHVGTETADCIFWPFNTNNKGYGQITVGGVVHRAHRLMYELAYGPIIAEQQVLHTCHNGHLGCVNPKHLKLGTNLDNIQDKLEAGRQLFGEAQGGAILKNKDIPAIIALMDEIGPSQAALRIGCSRQALNNIRIGVAWSKITIPFYQAHPEHTPHPSWIRRHGRALLIQA